MIQDPHTLLCFPGRCFSATVFKFKMDFALFYQHLFQAQSLNPFKLSPSVFLRASPPFSAVFTTRKVKKGFFLKQQSEITHS